VLSARTGPEAAISPCRDTRGKEKAGPEGSAFLLTLMSRKKRQREVNRHKHKRIAWKFNTG